MVEDTEYCLSWIIIISTQLLHSYCVTLSLFDISHVLFLSNYFWYFRTPRARGVLSLCYPRCDWAKTSTIQIDCNVFLLQTLPTSDMVNLLLRTSRHLTLDTGVTTLREDCGQYLTYYWIMLVIVLLIMASLLSSLSSLSFSDIYVRGMTRSCLTTVIQKPLAMTWHLMSFTMYTYI